MSILFGSSIGRKLVMALAGLFLILFLPVHLGINLTLILSDSTQTFNAAANFMAGNPVIKVFEVILFAALLLHVVYGLTLQVRNWMARPVRYKTANYRQTSFFSKFIIHTASVILTFLVIHLINFYFKSKFGHVPEVSYDGSKHYHDLAALVYARFQIPAFVIIYIVGFLFLGFHLLHGFQSAFQTLGLNHPFYTPIIKTTGIVYVILIVTGFTVIPLVIYFIRS